MPLLKINEALREYSKNSFKTGYNEALRHCCKIIDDLEPKQNKIKILSLDCFYIAKTSIKENILFLLKESL